jgi:hypothetical protein
MSIQGVSAGIRRTALVGFKHPSEKGIIYAASTLYVKKKRPVKVEPEPEKSKVPYGLKEISNKPKA